MFERKVLLVSNDALDANANSKEREKQTRNAIISHLHHDLMFQVGAT